MEHMKKIKVLIVDDHVYHNSATADVLSNHDLIEVVGTASNHKEMEEELEHKKVDLILLDIEMPSTKGEKDGKQIARELKSSKKYKSIKIVCFTINTQSHILRALIIDIGVEGYLDKHKTDKSILIKTILAVVNEETEFPIVGDLALKKNVNRILKGDEWPHAIQSLSPREREIMPLVAYGRTDEQIEQILRQENIASISFKTVNHHRMNLYRKLDCRNANQVAQIFYDYTRHHNDDIESLPNFKKYL